MKTVARKIVHEEKHVLKRELHYALLCAFCILIPIIFHPHLALADEIDMVNHPVNLSGLTGLLNTTAPYTLPPGTLEVSASILYETSVTPNYTITEYPFSITTGIGKTTELAIRGSYFYSKEGPPETATTYRNTGDIELSYKWNFLPQSVDSVVPGVALIVTEIAPTEKNPDMILNSVSHWGMRIGLSTGTEINWKEHVLGIYADAQMAGQDLTEKRLRDIYEIANAGLLFPISKNQNLQMFIEYSLVNDKDKVTLEGGDYTALTYGLRLVNERFNLTMGTQFLHKTIENHDNSGRIIGLMSMKF